MKRNRTFLAAAWTMAGLAFLALAGGQSGAVQAQGRDIPGWGRDSGQPPWPQQVRPVTPIERQVGIGNRLSPIRPITPPERKVRRGTGYLPPNFSDNLRPHAYLFRPCIDTSARLLVGMQREPALAKVRQMDLMQVRILHPQTIVNFESVPERLTLVIDDFGTVLRAFCR